MRDWPLPQPCSVWSNHPGQYLWEGQLGRWGRGITGTRTEKLPLIWVIRFKGKCTRDRSRAFRQTAQWQCQTYRITDAAERVHLPPPPPALGVGGHSLEFLRIPSWNQWGPKNAILSVDGFCWLFPPLIIYSWKHSSFCWGNYHTLQCAVTMWC